MRSIELMRQLHDILNRMKTGNARYAADGGLASEPEKFAIDAKAIASRSAIATVLTCSDIKASPELVFGLEIGELNVIQTPAGICLNPDTFGFEAQGKGEAKWLIIVLGHTPCGVIDHSLANKSDPLNKICDVILESRAQLVAASTLPTPISVCEAHMTSTTQELGRHLDPERFHIETAHLNENNGVVRFLEVETMIHNR